MSESNSNPVSESVSNENVKRILALLREGDEKINLAGFRDVVLVLGNTGSGKSTLTQLLAGNNNDLVSSEVGENTGEYIISDTNNKISVNATIISKTTFPEVVIDQETKTAFIDCPGFNDSRNEAFDIASAYFIKKVLENVQKVKILLVVSHPSLRKGVNRSDFQQLLEHVTILIKHIEKYVDGVSLVATKVDNIFVKKNGVSSLVADSSVIQNIAQFLLEVRESIKKMKFTNQIYTSEFKQAKNELFFQNTNKLLDALLQKNGNEYTRLGIFRRPDGPGRISDIQLLQNGKKVLKRMIMKNLIYVPVDMSDIGYAVSDKSKNIINEIVKEIDQNIAVDVAQIKQIVVDYSKELEQKMFDDDMYSLREYFNSTSKDLAQIYSINESAKADEIVSMMRENLPDTLRNAFLPYFNDINNLGTFIDFLQDVSDKQFDSFAWKWIKQLEGAVNYVDNSLKWYDFLAALHERLSQYDVQTDTSRFHVPKFNSSESVVLGNVVDFGKFLDEISNSDFLKLVNFKDLGKINVDGIKIRYFNRVIESTLRGSFDVSYSFENKLRVSGDLLKLSDVVKLLTTDYELTKVLQIEAKRTIFIDSDLSKNIDVSIVAPIWNIVGSRTINLNGLPGWSHFTYSAADGNRYVNPNGSDGLPGNPGESAGHFFGIGDVFVDARNLTITAIGGTGSDGQRGGNGASGRDGQSYYIQDGQYSLSCNRDEECYTYVSYSKSGVFNLNVKGEVSYTKYGADGGRGGDAGRGGAPGKGGNAGSITLISADGVKPPISSRVAKGGDGELGLHGSCGQGGVGGANQKARYYFGTWADSKNDVDRFYAGRGRNGEMGTCIYGSSVDNSNSKGRREPAIKEILYPPSFVITDFRTKIMSNFYNCVTKRRSLEFYKSLQKKEIIQYDNPDIIYNELETLELVHNRFSPDISTLIYSFLQDRIKQQATIVFSVDQEKKRKLLDFLSCAVSSKLTRLANRSQSRLVFDRQAYIDLLKTTDVAKIRAFFFVKAKEEIKSAANLIIIIRNSISDTVERTAGEIVELSKEDVNNELGSQMLKFKLFSNLRTIVEFLAFSASLAEADLALVNTLRVTSAVPSIQEEMSEVDGSLISASLSFVEEILGKPIEAIRNSVSKERKLLKSLGMEYDEINERLLDFEMTLKSRKPIVAKSFAYPSHSKIADVVESVAAINEDLLNNANSKALDASNKLIRDLKLIRFDADLPEAIMDSKVNVENVILSIDNLLGKVDKFDKTAQELFNLISPVFHDIRQSMRGDHYKPENLMAIRTMVYLTLDDIKPIIYKFIDGFEIDEDLQLIIENFDEAFGQLTAIFNEVLPSQHDRASLNSFSVYLEKDEVWGNIAQNYLIEVVKANALFYEYERLVDAVKKFISPFDVTYFNDPPLPTIGRTASSYRNPIVSNVNLLESQLKALEQKTKNETLTDNFNSDDQNGPFFVWDGENYQESISKLLVGREVALKASTSNKGRSVLKFNDIGLRFQSNDPNTQQSLDEELKNFNVIMTHTGSSYFSVCDRIQLINQEAVKFVYNFDNSTTQMDLNDTVLPTMSPFTTWIFKLNPVEENATFSSLLPYRTMNLNVELEGRASFFSKPDETVCQKIARTDHQSAPSTSTADTDQPTLIRKRRDVDSSKSEGIFNMKFLRSLNPFNYFIQTEPDPRFEYSSDPQLLQWNNEPSQPDIFSPSFNTNSTLILADYIVRNVTKVKPYQPKEKSINASEARAIAITILDEYESTLAELSENVHVRAVDLEQNDPIELLGQLEKYILAENYSKVVDLLSDSLNFDPSAEKLVRQRIIEVLNQSLNGDLHRNTIQGDSYDSPISEGALFGVMNGSDTSSNENFNQSALLE